MKLHASVGADILSAIAFPYPVVPIVRYHHENWDGTGYPTGLKGTSIPIGARILSVVDCFDALTSDRPYRPRLSDDEALSILNQRRGSMYDPLVVDTFVAVYKEITPVATGREPNANALSKVAQSTQPVDIHIYSAVRNGLTASVDEMVTLFELARALVGHRNVTDTADVITRELLRLIPSSLCIFFAYDPVEIELKETQSVGDLAPIVKGLRMGLGSRLSGWVAANRQIIVNSDASLDLGDVAQAATPRLRSCLSTPLLADDEIVGVLTFYSDVADGFNDAHRRIMELAARHIAHTFKRAGEFERRELRDSLIGLPSLGQFEEIIADIGVNRLSRHGGLTLLFIDVALEDICQVHGRASGDEMLQHIARHARSRLRAGDILLRHGSNEFVALLNNAQPETADAVTVRIRQALDENPLTSQITGPVSVKIDVKSVYARHDHTSLAELIAASHNRDMSIRGDSPSNEVSNTAARVPSPVADAFMVDH